MDTKVKPAATTASSAATFDINTILSERAKAYGVFEEVAMGAQTIKSSMRACGKHSWHSLDDDKKEALEMIASKIARIINNGADHEDSWRDIAGYATLVADNIRGIKR